MPLWQLLVQRGLSPTERAARALVMAGQVLVADRTVDKPGIQVREDMAVRLRRVRPFASRGGEKLEFALRRFGVNVHGRVALDAGASTGGFTDCLLRQGAVRVYAVDVGFGQLLGRLRQDARVVNMERTNLGDLHPGLLQPPPNLVTLDLSYLSLAAAWRSVQPLLAEGTDIVSLVKPLFEVQDSDARRTGVVRGSSAYVEVLTRLIDHCNTIGWSPLGTAASPVRGSRGTIEFLLHARNVPAAGVRPDVHAAVTEAFISEGAVSPQE